MAVRRVEGGVEERPKRRPKASKDDASSFLQESQAEEVVTKTIWESFRAVALALASVAVPLLLLQLKFVKDFSGIVAEMAIVCGSGWAGITVAGRMKGFPFWARAIVCVVLILGIAVIALFMAGNMLHHLSSRGSDE